jgi:Na+-translocating ferredoxin:NAD+ oxidoreductase subunit G
MRELLKLSIVLTIICCCAALSLAYVYNITKAPIAYQQQLKKTKAINDVFPEHGDPSEFDVSAYTFSGYGDDNSFCRKYYRIKKNDVLLGTAFEIIASGYGGDINIMVGVGIESKVTGIKIIRHSETPGLGANIIEEKFYNQFRNKNINTGWNLKKKGGDIDQVSGATISSVAVMNAVYDGALLYCTHKKEILNADSDL